MLLEAKTLGRLLKQRVGLTPHKNAYGVITGNKVQFYTFTEYFKKIEILGLALKKMGLKPQDKVCIFSNTRIEWHLFDLAIMCTKGITVPIYHSYMADDLCYIVNHCDSNILIIENDTQLRKYLSKKDQLSDLQYIISLDKVSIDSKDKIPSDVKFYSYDEIVEIGENEKPYSPDFFHDSLKTTSEEHIASIIYTSGTTGRPKGAVVTNKSLVQMLLNVKQFASSFFSESDRSLVFLPLSHVFGRADSLLPLVFGNEFVFARSINKIIKDLQITQPTVMLSVPRILEKIYEGIYNEVKKASPIKRKTFEWCVETASKFYEVTKNSHSPSPSLITQNIIAQRILNKEINKRLGNRLRYFISGGAPIGKKIVKFFKICNLPILEGYGLTETIAPCCLNPGSKQVPGTVGQPIGDVIIDFTSEGEIKIKSQALFSCYYKEPEETDRILKNGWLFTGDIGRFDEMGFLQITGRKKDIIITSGGKNIHPSKIENIMKKQPLISNFIVYGEGKNFLTGLVSIDKNSILQNESLSQLNHLTTKELSENELVIEQVWNQVKNANDELPPYETIKKILILPEELTTENYLTPSLKVKRNILFKNYQEVINSLYL